MKREELVRKNMYDILEEALSSFKNLNVNDINTFFSISNTMQIKHCLSSSGLNLDTIIRFYNDTYKNEIFRRIILNRLMRIELNLCLFSILQKNEVFNNYLQGYTLFDSQHIRDIECYIDVHSILLRFINLNGSETECFLSRGVHSFVGCTNKRVTDNYISKLKKCKELCENVHLVLTDDVKISPKKIAQIHSNGCNIIRLHISRNELCKKIMDRKSIYKDSLGKNMPFLHQRKSSFIPSKTLAELGSIKDLISSYTSISDPKELDAFIATLGEERIWYYASLNILENCYRFLNGNNSFLENMVGTEFNLILLDMLKAIGIQHIQPEFGKKLAKVDAAAYFEGTEPIITYLPDGSKKILFYPPGPHFFEAKASDYFAGYYMAQIYREKSVFENLHLFMLADTKVHYSAKNKLDEIGVDIIRSNTTKDMLINLVLNLRTVFNDKKNSKYICLLNQDISNNNSVNVKLDKISHILGPTRTTLYSKIYSDMYNLINFFNAPYTKVSNSITAEQLLNIELAMKLIRLLKEAKPRIINISYLTNGLVKLDLLINRNFSLTAKNKIYSASLKKGKHRFYINIQRSDIESDQMLLEDEYESRSEYVTHIVIPNNLQYTRVNGLHIITIDKSKKQIEDDFINLQNEVRRELSRFNKNN